MGGGGDGAPDAYFALHLLLSSLSRFEIWFSLAAQRCFDLFVHLSASLVIMFVVLAHGIPIHEINILATVHLSRNAAAFQYWYFIQTARETKTSNDLFRDQCS
jgi:hypothetical protein